MKNILVHVNPEKKFTSRFRKEKDILARIQIDNSLELGWNVKDIILYTNFPYEYRGVKAIVVPDEYYCPFRPLSTKTITVSHFLPTFDENEVYWVHDFDAFQLEPFGDISFDFLGMTDYGWSTKWCLGSYFVKKSAVEHMVALRKEIYASQQEDERALRKLTQTRKIQGITKLNITYNFGMRCIGKNYAISHHPIKVLHFHPFYKDTSLPETTLNMFMYGKNDVGVPLMSERLINLFKRHGIR